MAHITVQNERIRASYREGTLDGERIFENHCHGRFETIAVFEGSMSIVVDGERYTLGAGELIVIPPLAYHSVFTVGDVTYKRATFLFDEALIPREIKDDFLARVRSHPVSSEAAQQSVMRGLEEIFCEAELSRYLPLAESLLTEAMYIHTYKAGKGAESKINPTVKAVIEYIDAHITEKILLDDVAKALFLSKSTVCHLFASEMKISPKQYILQKKLAHAARLMDEGASAQEASRAIGYENYANFYLAFKKIFGESPRNKKHGN